MTAGLKEAAKERDRQQFAQDCVKMAKTIEAMFEEATRLIGDWNNNDFEQALTENDLRVYRFSLEDIRNFVGMLRAIQAMAGNMPVEQADYQRVNARIK